MRTHHKIVFNQPCFLAEQCISQGWSELTATYSVKLTLNIGLE